MPNTIEHIPFFVRPVVTHSAATEIRKQFGVEGAQVILGHASADVTQVYAERDVMLARKMAITLG